MWIHYLSLISTYMGDSNRKPIYIFCEPFIFVFKLGLLAIQLDLIYLNIKRVFERYARQNDDSRPKKEHHPVNVVCRQRCIEYYLGSFDRVDPEWVRSLTISDPIRYIVGWAPHPVINATAACQPRVLTGIRQVSSVWFIETSFIHIRLHNFGSQLTLRISRERLASRS